MKKILFFNFDGTDNEPADAMQDRRMNGRIEDDSITNVLKFHLLLGGNLKDDNGETDLPGGSKTFYYNGIGTYGNFFQRKFNAGLAKESRDVAKILNMARDDFKAHFSDDINAVIVIGFSRGAALARRFAAIINSAVNRPIIIEGVFDTVASIGMPNFKKEDRPSTDVVFEHGHTLPSNVKKALHLVSLDDKRKAFQPTLMNKDERVCEVWFAGAHGDVGGGYYYDGLSDNALRFFLDWFEELPDLGIRFNSSKNIDYKKIFAANSKMEIDADDVQIDPNPLGVNHQQERLPLISHLTLTDRLCCVIKEDQIDKDELPTVHWSVADRIGRSRDYRPKSLYNRKYKLLYQDDAQIEYRGISDHKLKSKSNFNVPTSDGVETRVYGHLKYNHTGIYLDKEKSYTIEVIDLDKHQWRDGSIKDLDGKGWNRNDIRWGLREAPIKLAEPFRRVTGKGVNWFTLCGCIGEDDDNAFAIGNKITKYSPARSGELCAFANDLKGYYGNNSGFLKIKVSEEYVTPINHGCSSF
jgi:pimeloyl-ACP methyl ester carboxylesterase